MLKQFHSLLAVLTLMLGSTPAYGATIDDILDPNANLLARIDVEHLDWPSVMESVGGLFGETTPDSIQALQKPIDDFLKALRKVDVREIYVSFALQDASRMALAIIVPSNSPAKARLPIEEMLSSIPVVADLSIHTTANYVVLAHDATWQRMLQQVSTSPSGLRKHYVEHQNNGLSITIGWSNELRAEVAEIWPQELPPPINIPLSPKALVRDIESLTLTCDGKAPLQLQVVADCESPAAAERVYAYLSTIILSQGMDIQHQSSSVIVTAAKPTLTRFLRPLVANQESTNTSNNMKQIILAMHNFHEAHRGFPPRNTVDPQGNPLLSWRVFLLPYLDQLPLYNEFHLDEPWDSPHNRQLIDKMPAVFVSSQTSTAGKGLTSFQVVQCQGSPWNGGENRLLRIQDITDGTSNTIAFVQAPESKSVIWTQPTDLVVSEVDNLFIEVFGPRDALPAAYFDGSVRILTRDQASNLHAYFTGQGKEITQ
ncbi:MAG: DUF1559 domain-containing protein [Planctomycetales bacterium]|nr:DUF1559 domain-containing protein [Planctomycetales bacterium]